MSGKTYPVLLIIILLISGCKTTSTIRGPIKIAGLSYIIQMPAPHTHYFDVSIIIPKVLKKHIDCIMPAWSPGRYIIYDFAQYVKDVKVNSGVLKKPVYRRLDKQTWRITGFNRGDTIIFSYKVYANYASGTFSQLTSEGALINGASVFMYLPERLHKPISLSVILPEEKKWSIVTSLIQTESKNFYAEDYEQLIDSPLSIGGHRSYSFSSYKKHVSVSFQSPETITKNEITLTANCRLLCDTAGQLFGGLPFSGYSFIFYTGFSPGIYDGMEHMNTCCITDAALITSGYDVEKMTALAAHELFHVWNIKCIRPVEFLSYDLSKETYTRSIWIIEGLTRYFQNVLQLRSGIITREKFRQNFSHYLTTYELNPGRKTTTLEDASLLMWLDRWGAEDTDKRNTRISNYNKGGIVGLLLDMKIRGATNGEKGLEDVLKKMYQVYYKKGRGYKTEDFYSECEIIAGTDLDDFFYQCCQSVEPLPYSECADLCGFIIENNNTIPVPYSGLELKNSEIINIIPGSSAEQAGLQKFDVIVSINNLPFTGNLGPQILKPGKIIRVTVLRYGKQISLPLTVAEKIPVSFAFQEKPLVSRETAKIREAFYTGNY